VEQAWRELILFVKRKKVMRSFELSRKTHTKQKLKKAFWEGEPEQNKEGTRAMELLPVPVTQMVEQTTC